VQVFAVQKNFSIMGASVSNPVFDHLNKVEEEASKRFVASQQANAANFKVLQEEESKRLKLIQDSTMELARIANADRESVRAHQGDLAAKALDATKTYVAAMTSFYDAYLKHRSEKVAAYLKCVAETNRNITDIAMQYTNNAKNFVGVDPEVAKLLIGAAKDAAPNALGSLQGTLQKLLEQVDELKNDKDISAPLGESIKKIGVAAEALGKSATKLNDAASK
jgi:hypothetical protein